MRWVNSIRNRLVCNCPHYLTPLGWCFWHPCCSIMSSLLRYGTLLRRAQGAMPGQARVMPEGSTLSLWMKSSALLFALVATGMQWKKIKNTMSKKCFFLHIDMPLPHVLLSTEVYLFSGKCSPRTIFCFSTRWGSFFSSVKKLVDMDVGIDRL